MPSTKRLIILTGPPGGGKTTFAAAQFAGLDVFDTDLGNKSEWRYSPTDAVLMTAAPSHETKQYWLDMAKKFGFTPTLMVCDPPRMEAIRRVKARDVNKNAQYQQRLAKSVQRWYKDYSRHPDEVSVCRTSSSSHVA